MLSAWGSISRGKGILPGLVICLGLVGCKGMPSWFQSKNPNEVLAKSENGDERAWALAQIEEPIRKGGNAEDQERVILRLSVAAKGEPSVPARLGAIQAMSRFSDPRVVTALEEAYYKADDFGPDSASVIRQQVLTALGETGHPKGIGLLTRVLNAPPIDDDVSEQGQQHQLDERMAAARSLKKFRGTEVATALQKTLQSEKDVALRDCARQSLQVVTGERLSPDAPLLDKMRDQIKPDRAIAETDGRPIVRTGGPVKKKP